MTHEQERSTSGHDHGDGHSHGHRQSPELVDTAEAALAAEPGVKAVRSIKMRWIGHRLHADAELDIDRATSLTEAHRIADDAEHTLTHAVPKLSTALIHAYPAKPQHPRYAVKGLRNMAFQGQARRPSDRGSPSRRRFICARPRRVRDDPWR